jgi:hypothetical protein
MHNDFCIFIISHNRAGDVPTAGALDRYNYTGDWYIVIDDANDIDAYNDEYGEETVVYLDNDDALPETDRGDNFEKHDTPLYTRNQLWDLADDLGYEYFLVFDDDYTNIQYRFDNEFNYNPSTTRDFDAYINSAIKYLESADLDTLCMAQGGDFIGGVKSHMAESVKTSRKAMNSFLCKTDRPFNFRGTMNDDVNTYVRAAQYGKLFLTSNVMSIEQETTQQNEGGITDLYKSEGTYVKSFYTVLYAPSCVSLTELSGRSADRIHHKISWRNAVPKIVPESAKSGGN